MGKRIWGKPNGTADFPRPRLRPEGSSFAANNVNDATASISKNADGSYPPAQKKGPPNGGPRPTAFPLPQNLSKIWDQRHRAIHHAQLVPSSFATRGNRTELPMRSLIRHYLFKKCNNVGDQFPCTRNRPPPSIHDPRETQFQQMPDNFDDAIQNTNTVMINSKRLQISVNSIQYLSSITHCGAWKNFYRSDL
jgi:hypothetical protein